MLVDSHVLRHRHERSLIHGSAIRTHRSPVGGGRGRSPASSRTDTDSAPARWRARSPCMTGSEDRLVPEGGCGTFPQNRLPSGPGTDNLGLRGGPFQARESLFPLFSLRNPQFPQGAAGCGGRGMLQGLNFVSCPAILVRTRRVRAVGKTCLRHRSLPASFWSHERRRRLCRDRGCSMEYRPFSYAIEVLGSSDRSSRRSRSSRLLRL